MDWTQALFQLIDLRSFSSIWYWIGLAVLWSTVSHWVLGVPYDLITRARRSGGQAALDLADAVRVNVNRLLHIARSAGLILVVFGSFLLSSLAILGFWYQVELAQAIFLMAFPSAIVGGISLSTARLIEAIEPEGDALIAVLLRHRVWTQVVGMCAIFVTAMYGMFQNLLVVRSL